MSATGTIYVFDSDTHVYRYRCEKVMPIVHYHRFPEYRFCPVCDLPTADGHRRRADTDERVDADAGRGEAAR